MGSLPFLPIFCTITVAKAPELDLLAAVMAMPARLGLWLANPERRLTHALLGFMGAVHVIHSSRSGML